MMNIWTINSNEEVTLELRRGINMFMDKKLVGIYAVNTLAFYWDGWHNWQLNFLKLGFQGQNIKLRLKRPSQIWCCSSEWISSEAGEEKKRGGGGGAESKHLYTGGSDWNFLLNPAISKADKPFITLVQTCQTTSLPELSAALWQKRNFSAQHRNWRRMSVGVKARGGNKGGVFGVQLFAAQVKVCSGEENVVFGDFS